MDSYTLMTKAVEKHLKHTGPAEVQNSAPQASEAVEAAFHGLEQKVLSEIAGAGPSENKTGKSAKSTKRNMPFFDFAAMSSAVQEMIYGKNRQIVLPSKEKQIRAVKRSIRSDQRKLVRQAKKLRKARKFSAAKLEQVVLKIRQLQLLLQELMNAAADRVEALYRQFVLRVA